MDWRPGTVEPPILQKGCADEEDFPNGFSTRFRVKFLSVDATSSPLYTAVLESVEYGITRASRIYRKGQRCLDYLEPKCLGSEDTVYLEDVLIV